MGPPGAGKSLQGQILAARYNLYWLSMGYVLRQMATPAEQAILAGGSMLPDEETLRKLEERLDQVNDLSKVILDGYPRDCQQAHDIVAYMRRRRQPIELVVVLDVGRGEILRRLTLRGRSDDNPDAIEKRLLTYAESSDAILNYFADRQIRVARIPASRSVGAVHDEIATLLARYSIQF